MNKKNYLWWIIGIVVVILLIYWLASMSATKNSGNTGSMSNTPATSETSGAAGQTPVVAPAQTPTPTTTPAAQTYTPPAHTPQPIQVQFMTTAQKKALNIDPSLRVQILQMTPDGKIAAYKIINKDSDILTSF